MKNKVVNLFGNKNIGQNEEVKYSALLTDFIKPFEHYFPEDFDMEDIIDFSMNAWNFANMSSILPKQEFKNILSSAATHGSPAGVLKKMIDRKIAKFKEHDLFIGDFNLEEGDGEFVLTVKIEQKEEFLEKLMAETDREPIITDFEPGYINRYAIVLKPRQPFVDWINRLERDHQINEVSEASIYLVTEEVGDLEQWLRKNYNKFFSLELENEILDKKNWPQNRNFKMFKQWFNVELSTMIYDLENTPVYKED